MTHPKLYKLSHGWATKYYWFSLVQEVYVGMDFVDGIKKGELTLEIDTGTTEADSHGCTMALTFFSERIASVFESHSSKSFNKYPLHFTKEANIQGDYFYIDVVRSHLKNGRLRLKPEMGASQWNLPMNNGP